MSLNSLIEKYWYKFIGLSSLTYILIEYKLLRLYLVDILQKSVIGEAYQK